MTETISLRASRYFGMEQMPRTTVPVGDGKCLVVAHRDGRLVMAVYEEFGSHRKGIYVNFTDRQYERFFNAIDKHWTLA